MGKPVDYKTLELRNPHSVLAALERRPRDVLELSLPPGGGTATWEDPPDGER